MTDYNHETRLWKVLESIEKRLGGIEQKLENVVRLEERVNNHDEVIVRYGNRLDEGDHRMRKLELWQAEHNPDMIITTLKSNRDTIDVIKNEVDSLKETGHVNKGRKDISKEILKWVAGILAAIIIYQATRGS